MKATKKGSKCWFREGTKPQNSCWNHSKYSHGLYVLGDSGAMLSVLRRMLGSSERMLGTTEGWNHPVLWLQSSFSPSEGVQTLEGFIRLCYPESRLLLSRQGTVMSLASLILILSKGIKVDAMEKCCHLGTPWLLSPCTLSSCDYPNETCVGLSPPMDR